MPNIPRLGYVALSCLLYGVSLFFYLLQYRGQPRYPLTAHPLVG